MEFLKAFLFGGFICLIAQILLDKTKLSSGRILVFYVCIGCILGGMGIYKHLVDLFGAGATTPLTGFGYNLAKGVIEEVDKIGACGIVTGGLRAAAGGLSVAVITSFICAIIFEPKEK